MEKIVIFGKGGIGKSFISSNLSYIYAAKGMRVLHVGCDPKRDSTSSLLGRRPDTTAMDELLKKHKTEGTSFFMRGRLGINCVESGGPEPGVGCSGRGIVIMVEQFEKMGLMCGGEYDVAVFDILGDLVCGGFAAPLRYGFAEKVFIVVSEELMSLHAANNIAKMIPTYAGNGVVLGGLIANLRNNGAASRGIVEEFARRLSTRVIGCIERDPLVSKAERETRPVAESAPNSRITGLLRDLAEDILNMEISNIPLPTPMADAQLDAFFKQLPEDSS